MNIKNKIKSIFSKKTKKEYNNSKAFLVFEHTAEVIKADNVLKSLGFTCDVMAPPENYRTGCDMVIVFDIINEPVIKKELAKHNLYVENVINVQSGMLEPLSLYQVKDFGDYLMIRAANMKITIEKSTKKIVNVSGGGCPDVPYLASIIMNKSIFEAEEPRVQGQTLCSFSLQYAFKEAQRLCNG